MKTLLIGAVVLLFACGMAFAQNQNADTTNPVTGTHDITLTGCLQGSPGHFAILTAGGKQLQIQSRSKDLDKLVGHTIAATGVQEPGPASSSSDSASYPNATNTGSEAIFTAGEIVDISPNCGQSTTRAKPKP